MSPEEKRKLFEVGRVYPTSHAGWVTYKCDECGTEWTELTRDAQSESRENCINEDCEAYPYNADAIWSEVHGWPLDVVDAILSQGRVVRI